MTMVAEAGRQRRTARVPDSTKARLTMWGILALLVVGLELATRMGAIPDTLMVPPSEMVVILGEIVPTASFMEDFWATTATILISFAIGVVGGIPLGVLLWRLPTLARILDPFLVTGYAMPTLLFYPVLLALLGLNTGPIIAIASLMALIPIALTTAVGLNAVKPILHKLANSLNATNRQYYLKVLLPAATPHVFPGIKLGFIYSVIGTIAMEFILAPQGIGFRAGFSYRELHTGHMWAYIAVVVLLSILVNSVLTWMEKRIRKDML